MEFKNRKDFILRCSNMSYVYFKLRDFKVRSDVSFSSEDVINHFIKSKYFIWQDGRNNWEKGRNKGEDWNFHGVHDASKIVVSDFIPENFTDFRKELLDFIIGKSGDGKVTESTFKMDRSDIRQLMKDPLGYIRGRSEAGQHKHVDYSEDIKFFIESVEKMLDEYGISGNFYKLNLSEKEKRNKFTVFIYLFSAIMVNTDTNTFVTIEFGLD